MVAQAADVGIVRQDAIVNYAAYCREHTWATSLDNQELTQGGSMKTTHKIPLITLLGLGLTACESGGPDSATQTSSQTATVSVLLTDAAGTQWDQAFATITTIELIGNSDRVTLFSGEETVDLLSLGDYSELFTVAEGVMPGVFAKIRLRVVRLELVELDEMGSEVRRVDAKLVGNGKIDINPRRPFAIAGGDVLIIEIDFDMHKSFKTIETGNGEFIVRPVVFATIKTSSDSSRLTRISGTVDEIDAGQRAFVLCQTSLSANHEHDDANRGHDDDDDDDGRRHCIDVTTDDATGVFGPDGLPVTFADIVVDDALTAVGFLHRDDDDDDVEDGDDDDADENDDEEHDGDEGEGRSHGGHADDFVLEAVVLELGDDFARFTGIVDGAVSGDLFDFALAPEQGFEPDTVIATQFFPTTRIFAKTGGELDELAIVPDANAIVDGVIAPGSTAADDRLRAALIVIDTEAEAAEEILRGEIVSVNAAAGTLQLLAGTMDRCVDARNAEIFLISDDDGLVSERGELADLVAGQRADAYGTEGVDGCFVASDILVDTE